VIEGYVSEGQARETYGVVIENGRVRGLTAERKKAGRPSSAS
jgi:hypothetical protein